MSGNKLAKQNNDYIGVDKNPPFLIEQALLKAIAKIVEDRHKQEGKH